MQMECATFFLCYFGHRSIDDQIKENSVSLLFFLHFFLLFTFIQPDHMRCTIFHSIRSVDSVESVINSQFLSFWQLNRRTATNDFFSLFLKSRKKQLAGNRISVCLRPRHHRNSLSRENPVNWKESRRSFLFCFGERLCFVMLFVSVVDSNWWPFFHLPLSFPLSLSPWRIFVNNTWNNMQTTIIGTECTQK